MMVRCPLVALFALALSGPALLAAERDADVPSTPRLLDLSALDSLDVDPLSGRLRHERPDLVRGEGPSQWQLVRHWSATTRAGSFGPGWACALDAQLLLGSEQTPVALIDERGAWHLLEAKGDVLRARLGVPFQVARSERGWTLSARRPGETLRFDRAGRVAASLRDGQVAWRVTARDTAGRPAALVGPWGRAACARDARGRIVEVRAPGGALRYAYDEAGRLTLVGDARRYLSYGYDEADRLVSLADERALVRYDAQGRVEALEGPGVLPLRLSYRERGGALVIKRRRAGALFVVRSGPTWIETTLPTGGRERIELDPRGRPLRRSWGGATWTWRYDPRGRVVERGTPSGSWRFQFKGASSRPARVERPDGSTICYGFDAAGRVVSAADAASGTTRYAYDAEGRLASVRGPHGATDRLRYDGAGYCRAIEREGAAETTAVRGPDGVLRSMRRGQSERWERTLTPTGERLRLFEHGRLRYEVSLDARGRPRWTRDARRGTTRYRWNARGQLLEARDAGGLRLSAGYDLHARLTWLQDGAGNRAFYVRLNACTLLVRDPSSGTRRIERDAWGRVTREVRGGRSVTLRYRGAQLVERCHDGGRDRFDYDGAGRLTRLSGPAGGYSIAYDSAGRLSSLQREDGTHAVRYRYDPRTGARSTAQLPWGEVGYGYDPRGRLTSLRTPAGETIHIERDAEGARLALRYPNGVVTRYRRSEGLLRCVETRRGDELLSLRAYDYDEVGRPSSVRDESGAELHFARDARGRVVKIAGAMAARYRYDAGDNRLTAPSELTHGNRLRAQGELRLGYDAQGALTSLEGPRGTLRLAHDVDGHLVRATTPGGQTVRYGYAPNGLRLWREVNGARTDYLHDGANVVAELREGELQAGYLHGEGVDDLLALRLAGSERELYAHGDALGSLIALSDGEGAAQARFRYGAFGETLASEGPLAERVRYRFTGREQDALTGLYHYRARTYVPELGRFSSPDPTGRAGGTNLYAYVANDPTRFVDPWGRRALEPQADAEGVAAFQDFGWWDLRHFARGFRDGVRDAAVALGAAIVNWRDSWRAIRDMFRNPREFVESLLAHYGERFREIQRLAQTDADAFYAEIGRLTGELVVSVAAGGAVGVAGRTLILARRAARAQRGGDAPLREGAEGRVRNERGRPQTACFLAGTLVETRGGRVAIERLRVGMEVLSRDEGSGEVGYRRILQRFSGHTARVVRLWIARPHPRGARAPRRVGASSADDEGGEPPPLRCTPEHPFWVQGQGWVSAAELRAGDRLTSAAGGTVLVARTELRDESAAHFNLEVADWHTYFVAAAPATSAVWVHNDCVIPAWSEFSPGQGFSGLFDPDSGTVMLRPSTPDSPPSGWVPRRGGHWWLRDELRDQGLPVSSPQGFTAFLEPDGNLRLEYFSRSLNGGDLPHHLQEPLRQAVEQATNLVVRD